jgi:hypothetical protein
VDSKYDPSDLKEDWIARNENLSESQMWTGVSGA